MSRWDRLTRTIRIAVLGISLWLAGGMTLAAEKWEWTLAPYLWMSDVGMDQTVDGEPALGADIAFSDLVDKLEGAFQVHFEGRNARLGFLVDLTFLSLADRRALDADNPAGLPPGSEVDTDLDLTFIEGAGFYRLAGKDDGLDVLFGFRDIAVDQETDITDPLGMPITMIENSPGYTDGLLGLRYLGHFAERWGYRVRADYGAGDTEGVFNGIASLDYSFGKRGKYAVLFGWRIMDMEIEETSEGVKTQTDLTMSGPFAAFIFRFGRQ